MIIYYSYDESGNIIGLKYNNTEYYYIKNLQGDIIGLLDNNFQKMVSYTYDSWGVLISVKDSNGNEITDPTHIGLINPYRYRSYRYDTETGLYYLNSRYYNPEWGRFLNADGIFESGHELLGNNLYVYCGNNPVNYHDSTGQAFSLIAGVFIGVVAILGITAVPEETWREAGQATVEIIEGAVNSCKSAVSYVKNKVNSTSTEKKQPKQSHNLPTVSKPNTSLELKEADGTIKQKRFYGPDGRATRDIDYKHPDDGTHKFPHEHQWNWDTGIPTRSK